MNFAGWVRALWATRQGSERRTEEMPPPVRDLYHEATETLSEVWKELERRTRVVQSAVATVDEMTARAKESDLPQLVDDLQDLRLILMEAKSDDPAAVR